MSTTKKTPEKLTKLVKKNPNFEFLENGKIRCIVTGHELMPSLDDYNSYIKGKSYKRAIENSYSIKGYEQYLVENKKDPNFLYCKITNNKVAKKKSVVEKHLSGKMFLKRLKEVQQEEARKAAAKQAGNEGEMEEENEEDEEDILEQDLIGDDSEEEEEKPKNKKGPKVSPKVQQKQRVEEPEKTKKITKKQKK